MAKLVIDAENAAMGRIASYAAKQALQGNEIAVLNCEKAVISGRKEDVIEDYKLRRQLNTMKPGKGPFFTRYPERIMKRTIRGMLPDHRKGRGKEAWRRIRCYLGVPEEFKKDKHIKLNLKFPQKNISLTELKIRM